LVGASDNEALTETFIPMQKRTHNIKSRIRRDDGQAFVEFAIVLPMLVLLVFGITQFGMAFRNYLAITDAARVAARAAAVKRTSSPCTAARTAIQNTVSAGQWTQISGRITCTAGPNVGDQVKIAIKYPYSIGLPGVSASGDLTANATERME
jgi:Flp pilus assembly protein TadG